MKWLRFSLRTLIVFALLLGSAATLWWNWGPWARCVRVEAPDDITNVWFSEDDRFVVFVYGMKDPVSKVAQQCLDIRYADSGVRLGTLKTHYSDYVEAFGNYVTTNDGDTNSDLLAKHIYNYTTLEELPLRKALEQVAKAGADVETELHFSRHFALLTRTDGSCRLWHLPDFTIVKLPVDTFPDDAAVTLNLDDRLLVNRGTQLEVHDLASGQCARVPIVDPPTKDTVELFGTTIVYLTKVSRNGTEDENIHVFDAQTGALLLKTPCTHYDASMDGRTLAITGKDGVERVFHLPSTEGVPTGMKNSAVSPDGALLVGENSIKDAHTFAMLWTCERDFAYWGTSRNWISPDSSLLALHDENHFDVVDARTGSHVVDFKAGNRDGVLLFNTTQIVFGKQRPQFAVFSNYIHCLGGEHVPNERTSTVWKPRRPQAWYGPAYLPEFWATALLALAFIWSLWRDRQTLKTMRS